MDAFLKLVAEDLKQKYDGKITDLTVVFPNNRARLFFNNFLLGDSDQPMWSPFYTTIQDLFLSCTKLKVADEIKLVCELYNVYLKHIDWEELGVAPETMDDFYFWGEVLLSDFEDVDNNLVDAEQLFRNITELADLEGDLTDILTPEQKAALEKFFQHFAKKDDSIIKKKFAALWNAMWPIYQEFRQNLLKKDIAYGGMIHRMVAEEIDMSRFPSEHYVFVGFNVLNKCEIALFKALRKAGKAIFYWDVDDFYMETPGVNHEAATFMKQNLQLFPNELSKEQLNSFSAAPKSFTIVSSSTNNAQAKYLSTYLQQRKEAGDADSDTAVVLCDESMLLPSLHSIPDSVQDLNITMGLPLIQTPIYAMVKVLLEMRSTVAVYGSKSKTIPLRFVKEALINPYVQLSFDGVPELFDEIVKNNIYFPEVDFLMSKNEDTTLLFSFLKDQPSEAVLPMLDWMLKVLKKVSLIYREKEVEDDNEDSIYDALYKESLYRCYTLVNRLYSLVESGDLTVNLQTMCKLLERLLSSTSVPFSGEPVKGMQIMGFLETRNLDFKNVVMLSVNEGTLPKGGAESSFIPYSLKKGFEMTTIDHKNSLYAYYFYRLLQRVENATFMYSSATTGGAKGLMSRFLMQLIVEKGDNVTLSQKDLRSDIQVALSNEFEVTKTEAMVDILRKRCDKNFGGTHPVSPSMLNTYLACPLKFYFSYVVGLREPDDLDDSVDQRMLGLIVHKTLENIYNSHKGILIEKHIIAQWLKEEHNLEKEVDAAFMSEFFHHDHIVYSGQQLLMKMTALTYVKNALTMDMELAPFSIVGDESKETYELDVDGIRFDLGGYIDRLQMSESGYQVVDYKTGGKPNNSKIFADGFAQLFSASEDRHYLAYAFQVWLYAYMRYKNTGVSVTPYLMFVRSKGGLINPSDSEDLLHLNGSNANAICGEIEENLKELIREIFSLEQPFKMTSNVVNCGYCPFVEICQGKK